MARKKGRPRRRSRLVRDLRRPHGAADELLRDAHRHVHAGPEEDADRRRLDARRLRHAARIALRGIIESDGIPTRPNLKNIKQAPPEQGSDFTAPSQFDRPDDGIAVTSFDRAFALAAASLRQALQDMPEITEVSKNIIIEETQRRPERVHRRPGRPRDVPGRLERALRAHAQVLAAIAPAIRKLPNRIADQRPYLGAAAGLAAGLDRVGPLRRARRGRARDPGRRRLPDERFASVSGKADTEPMFPDNPYLPANRRVTITLHEGSAAAALRQSSEHVARAQPAAAPADDDVPVDPVLGARAVHGRDAEAAGRREPAAPGCAAENPASPRTPPPACGSRPRRALRGRFPPRSSARRHWASRPRSRCRSPPPWRRAGEPARPARGRARADPGRCATGRR